MSVEILTVSLSDESINNIAEAVIRRIQAIGGAAATQSNPPVAQTPQPAEPSGFQPQADPWTNPAPAQAAPQATQPAPQSPAQQYQPPAPQQPQQAVQTPTCAHGPMRYVPAGFSQSTGRAYGAFWGCPAPRGAPDKCKSVTA